MDNIHTQKTTQFTEDLKGLYNGGKLFVDTFKSLEKKKDIGFLDLILLFGVSVNACYRFDKAAESGKELLESMRSQPPQNEVKPVLLFEGFPQMPTLADFNDLKLKSLNLRKFNRSTKRIEVKKTLRPKPWRAVKKTV